jgi:hypothetical protein
VLTAAPADPPAQQATSPDPEHRLRLTIGAPLRLAMDEPRRCTGVWTGTRRTPCPFRALLPDSTDSQCPACAARDHGRAIARDAYAGGDGRTFTLYLAWFGPGLIKIGLTAADRGRDRLLEQGAIAFTLLASGPYAAIRRAEHLIATARLVPERLSPQAKILAWWNLPDVTERARELTAARDTVTAHPAWPGELAQQPGAVTDQARDYGLGHPPPDAYQEITGLPGGATLAGNIRLIIGRHLLLDTAIGPLLADMRRVAGWTLSTRAARTAIQAATVTRIRPQHDHDRQQALF